LSLSPVASTAAALWFTHSGSSKTARCIQQIWNESAGAGSVMERLRGANQVAIIAIAARLVLHSDAPARFILIR
jgi:hypothetical protein